MTMDRREFLASFTMRIVKATGRTDVLMTALALLSLSMRTVAFEVHVSPDGNDTAAGTHAAPLATLTAARDRVRARRAQGETGPVTVLLHDGTYRVRDPLLLTPEDNGSAAAPVTYAAAEDAYPVISGGVPVGGWRDAGDGVWETRIDAVRDGQWRFRELFVNGRRAVRARHPNRGTLRVDETAPDQRSWFTYRADDVPACADADRVELIMLHDWAVSRAPVAAINAGSRRVSLARPLGRGSWLHKMRHWEPHPRYYLENSLAFFDAPGEWHLDEAAGLLRYRPLPGERLADITAVAPAAAALLVLRGEPGAPDRFVEHIRFQGIIFEHCAFTLPKDGFYCGVQATFHFPDAGKAPRLAVPPAVSADLAASCAFTDCVFRHLGGGGVWLGRQCRDNVIEACAVSDVSGNGVMIGEPRERQVDGRPWLEAVPGQVARGNRVHNSLVERCGVQFHGAVGIWSGIAAGTQITQCEIRDLPYSGVSAGWKWDPSPTPCRETRIEGNHIHDVMGVLSDGGGIYTLGLQPESIIRGNLIHGVPANAGRAESNGMFLDQGTTDFTIEKNMIYDVARDPLRFHQATKNLVRENVFVCPPGIPPIRYNRTEPGDIVKTDNTVLERGAPTPVDGVRGRAMRFDGAQSIDIPHSDALEPETFTLAAWVKLDRYPRARPSAAGGDRRSWVVGKNRHEWENGHIGLVIKDAGAAGAYINIGGGADNTASAFTAEGAVPLGQWVHLVARYDGAELVVCVNGTRAASTAVNQPREPGKGDLTIGRRPDGYTHFVGDIDEVVFYGRALSGAEIEALSKPGNEPAAPGRIGYWPLESTGAEQTELDAALETAGRTAGIEPQVGQRLQQRVNTETTGTP